MHPVLADVVAAFDGVPTHGHDIVIDRDGIRLPAGGHFQGIQRLSGTPAQLVITSSSKRQAYIVVCDVAADGTRGRARPPTQLTLAPLRHAGGCQTVDRFLVVGVEDNRARTRSEVQLWDLRSAPRQLADRTIVRAGPANMSTAGAVGVTGLGAGAVIGVASWNARTIDFYVCSTNPFGVDPPLFVHARRWRRDDADRAGWADANFGVYESINLVTDIRGAVYLVGFGRNAEDEDWMDLYAIDLAAPPARTLTKVGMRRMYCTNGCSFRSGAGIHIPSSSRLEVYAVNAHSGPHDTGTTIYVNQFSSASP